MPSQITNLTPMTELDAVNAILASIGEAPVDDLASAAQDVAVALNILRDNTREVQSWGWRFNAEWELPVAEAATFDWTDPDGSTVSLRIFTPPADLATFKVSPRSDQIGLDLALRPAKQYDAANKPLVFYDRARNRDGLPATERTLLYLDTISLFDFEKMPATVRQYVTIRAARQMQEKELASGELGSLTARDEMMALRAAKRDQGEVDTLNVLQSASVAAFHLGRQPGPRGVMTPRRYWRP